METASRPIAALDGRFDLSNTLESGQSYLERLEHGRMSGGDTDRPPWYSTVPPSPETVTNGPEVLRVRQADDLLGWESSTPNAGGRLERLLRLDDDLDAILESVPSDPLVDRAYEAHRGMRLVRDPPFGCLISFICSAQMRVERIHGMQIALSEAYGETVRFDGTDYDAFPTPKRLSEATEDELRGHSLGYRAPYVRRTATMVAEGEADPAEAIGLDYEEARESVTRFVGVGQKVADCVLLFSLGYLEAVPLDTWIRGAIEEHYPECDRGNYAETSRAIRSALGGDYAGYTQTYLFHYLRSGGA